MHRYDITEETDFVIPLLMTLQQLDTRLVTVLIDVSGSFNPRVGFGALKSVADAVSICAVGCKVNVVFFDNRIENLYVFNAEDLRDALEDMRWFGGGGTVFNKVMQAISGEPVPDGFFRKDADADQLVHRTGDLANTPIVLVSDGIFDASVSTCGPAVNLNDRKIAPEDFPAPFDENFIYLRFDWQGL